MDGRIQILRRFMSGGWGVRCRGILGFKLQEVEATQIWSLRVLGSWGIPDLNVSGMEDQDLRSGTIPML